MFSLSIILTFKNHQSTKHPFPFKTIIALKNLRNVWWKSSHTETRILNYVVNSKTRQKMIVLFLPLKRSSFVSAIFLINCWLVSKTMAVILSIILSHHNHHYHHPHSLHHLHHQHYWLNGLRKKPTETATNIVSVSVWLWTLLEGLASLTALMDSSCEVINVKDHGKTESISSMLAF